MEITKNSRRITAALLSVLVIAIVSIFAMLLMLSPSLHSEIVTLEKTGSHWVSEDGKISFSIYRELWFWDVDEIEENRYIALGTIDTGDEVLDISCICYNNSMSMNLFGLSCDYTNFADKIMADFEIEASDENEFVAIVYQTNFAPGQNYFEEGDRIRFVQTNNVNDIDVSDYEFYVDTFDILDAASNNTEINMFKTIDEVIAFRNSQQKVEP